MSLIERISRLFNTQETPKISPAELMRLLNLDQLNSIPVEQVESVYQAVISQLNQGFLENGITKQIFLEVYRSKQYCQYVFHFAANRDACNEYVNPELKGTNFLSLWNYPVIGDPLQYRTNSHLAELFLPEKFNELLTNRLNEYNRR